MAFLKNEIYEKDRKMAYLIEILKANLKPNSEKKLMTELNSSWGSKQKNFLTLEEFIKVTFNTPEEKL